MVGHTHPASVPGEEHCSQEVREFVSGSSGQGGTLYEGERVYLVHPQNCIHPIPHKQSPQKEATCQDQRCLYLRFQESQVPAIRGKLWNGATGFPIPGSVLDPLPASTFLLLN